MALLAVSDSLLEPKILPFEHTDYLRGMFGIKLEIPKIIQMLSRC